MSHRKKAEPKRTYKVAIYDHHPSGIGSVFIRYEFVEEKPGFDNGYWLDVTNSEWAKWRV